MGVGVGLAILLAGPKIAGGQNGGERTASSRAIVGDVRDTAGLPITGVQVLMNGRPLALTDASGHFRLNATGEPSLSLLFRRLGYEPVTRTVSAGDTSSPALNVVMTPNSPHLRGHEAIRGDTLLPQRRREAPGRVADRFEGGQRVVLRS